MVRLTNRSSAAKRPSIPQTTLGGALKPSHAEQQSVNPEVGVEEGDLETQNQADTSLAEDSTEKLGLAGSRKRQSRLRQSSCDSSAAGQALKQEPKRKKQDDKEVAAEVGSERRNSTRKRRKASVYQHGIDSKTNLTLTLDTMMRWTETKDRLGIATDDDLAKYFLDYVNSTSGVSDTNKGSINGDDEPPQLLIKSNESDNNAEIKNENGGSTPAFKETCDKEVQTSPKLFFERTEEEDQDSSEYFNGQERPVDSKFLQIRDDKLCRHCDTVHSELPNLGSKSPSRQDEVDTSGQLQACPFQNPLVVISDSVIDFSSKESADDRENGDLSMKSYKHLDLSKSFAQLSLPECLEIMDGAPGWKVVAKTGLKKFSQFGPLQGEKFSGIDIPDESEMTNLWPIFGKCSDTTTYMTTANPEKSNWFRYVRPASTRKDRNVVSVFKNGEMFFISSKDIAKGQEILYWTDIPNKVIPDKLCRKYFSQMKFVEEGISRHSEKYERPNAASIQKRFRHFMKKYSRKDEFKFSSLQKKSEATAIGCQNDDDAGDHPNLNRTSVSSPPQILRVKCTKCSRTFKNKSNLKIHMLTHSGVKPFSCKIDSCKTGFTTKQCLQFHYRKTHGLNDEEMPKIEREIPYTLSAYSGGLAKDEDFDDLPDAIPLRGPKGVDRDPKRSLDVGKGDGYSLSSNMPAESVKSPTVAKGSEESSAVDETSPNKWNVTRRKRKMPIKRVCLSQQCGSQGVAETTTNSGDVYDFTDSGEEEGMRDKSNSDADGSQRRSSTEEAKASLLVAAALFAAEHDLAGPPSPGLRNSEQKSSHDKGGEIKCTEHIGVTSKVIIKEPASPTTSISRKKDRNETLRITSNEETQCKNLMAGREVTITPALNPISPRADDPKDLKLAGEIGPRCHGNEGGEGAGLNTVDVIPITSLAAMDSLATRYAGEQPEGEESSGKEQHCRNSLQQQSSTSADYVSSSPLRGQGSSSYLQNNIQSIASSQYNQPPTADEASASIATDSDHFSNQVYQSGIENLSRVASTYPSRIQDYNATGQYQSGSGRVAACSNDYSTTNESLYNTMYSSLDLSASAAAMSDMLMARQYSGGGGHAPSSTPPLSYNSAAINEHLLQVTASRAAVVAAAAASVSGGNSEVGGLIDDERLFRSAAVAAAAAAGLNPRNLPQLPEESTGFRSPSDHMAQQSSNGGQHDKRFSIPNYGLSGQSEDLGGGVGYGGGSRFHGGNEPLSNSQMVDHQSLGQLQNGDPATNHSGGSRLSSSNTNGLPYHSYPYF